MLLLLQRGQVDPLEEEQLPEQLQGLKERELQARVAALRTERTQAQQALAGLVAQRDAWLRKNAGGGDAFDRQVVTCLKAQAEAAGLAFADPDTK